MSVRAACRLAWRKCSKQAEVGAAAVGLRPSAAGCACRSVGDSRKRRLHSVAAVRALCRFGAADVGVKWPNDLLWRDRKLAGILIEMRGESGGPAHVVIGIGMNVSMPASMRSAVTAAETLPISDLREVLDGHMPTRNQLAGALIDELARMLQSFSRNGFAPFVDQWRSLDMLANAPVRVISGIETIIGIARGVELDGTLLVEVDGQMRRFASGDVSLRRSE